MGGTWLPQGEGQRKLSDTMKSMVMKINTPEVNYYDLAEHRHTLHLRPTIKGIFLGSVFSEN